VVYAMQGHLRYYKEFYDTVPYVQPPWELIATLRAEERCKIISTQHSLSLIITANVVCGCPCL